MIEQLCLAGIDVPYGPPRLRPTMILLGRFWIAECRAVLAAAEKSEKSLD